MGKILAAGLATLMKNLLYIKGNFMQSHTCSECYCALMMICSVTLQTAVGDNESLVCQSKVLQCCYCGICQQLLTFPQQVNIRNQFLKHVLTINTFAMIDFGKR